MPRFLVNNSYSIVVGPQNSSNIPVLSMKPTHKVKCIPNIEAWTLAFQIFVGVDLTKFPMEAPALMKYGKVVRDLTARGGDWCFYNAQFRHLGQTNSADTLWDNTY